MYIVLPALVLVWQHPVAASLGGDIASVTADRMHSQGALQNITQTGTYTVHDMRMASGTVVREYSSTTGRVFGVAWAGPWLPDLQQLLGPYFDRYQAGLRAAQKRRGRGPIVIDTPDLVVRVIGHPRAFSGTAYVPSMMPLGIQPESIR
jgi:hypothetical protein